MPEFIDFDSIGDTLDDAGKNVKKSFIKLKNNKIFLFALAGTAALALITIIRRKNATGEEVSTFTIPTGYSGYPSTGGGGAVYDSGYASDSMAAMDDLKAGIYDVYADEYDNIYSNMDVLNERLLSVEEVANTAQYALDRQSIISQMQANSNYYALTSDYNTRQYLHEQNQSLASQLKDVYFDSDTGYWMNADGTKLYTPNILTDSAIDTAVKSKTYNAATDYAALIADAKSSGADAATIAALEQQRKAKIVGEGLNDYVTYDATVDYAAAIQKAISSGASDTEVKYLQMQREAKIKGENLNNDGTPKTSTKTSSGSTTVKSASSGSGGSSSSGHSNPVTPSNASTSKYAVYNPKTGKLNYTATKKAEMAAKGR